LFFVPAGAARRASEPVDIQKSMGKDDVNRKKRARTDSIGLAGEFTPKKKRQLSNKCGPKENHFWH